jgi:hypothetical protein
MTSAVPGRLRARYLRLGLLPPILLAACVFLVHDVGYAVTHNYWADEAWVAITTKYPLSELPDVTSSTPIGWSVLARLFVFGGPQSARLLTLAFAAAAVAVAYTFARGLGWRDDRVAVSAGVLAVVGVLMVPAMLVRNDLKQYTADACFALAALALTSRLERDWSRRGLAMLAATVGGGMLFSHTVAFVGAAAFIAIGIVQLARRQWRQALELAVAGAAALVVMVTVYEVFDARAVVPGLTAYWHRYYVPVHDGIGASWHFLYLALKKVGGDFGLGPVWLAVPVVLAGLVTLVRVGRPMTACAIVLLAAEMITVSGLKKYPLLDLRTSTFLIVIVVVVAAIGVVGLCVLLRRWIGVASAILGVAAAAFFVAGAFHDVRSHTLGNENVRAQTNFVASHRGPDDVIIVSLLSNWGFAYYWHHGPISRTPNSAVLQGYLVDLPTQPKIVFAPGRDAPGVRIALIRGLMQTDPKPGARIWLVRTHSGPTEMRAWSMALHEMNLTAEPVGPVGLTVITVG